MTSHSTADSGSRSTSSPQHATSVLDLSDLLLQRRDGWPHHLSLLSFKRDMVLCLNVVRFWHSRSWSSIRHPHFLFTSSNKCFICLARNCLHNGLAYLESEKQCCDAKPTVACLSDLWWYSGTFLLMDYQQESKTTTLLNSLAPRSPSTSGRAVTVITHLLWLQQYCFLREHVVWGLLRLDQLSWSSIHGIHPIMLYCILFFCHLCLPL